MKNVFRVLCVVFMVMAIGCWVSGCATFFPEPTPLCTSEEQETSIIYGFLKKVHSNPTATDFTLLFGTATQLEKHPEMADDIIDIATKLKTTVNEGITYATFASKVKKKLKPMQYVVASKMLKKFETIHIPIKPCDKRLIVGHLENQIELAQRVLR